jgi:hypothetical protein
MTIFITYASSYTMTEAPSSLMQTISIKELVLQRCSLTSQSALDGLRLSLSRKVKWSTLNFCEFNLLRFYFITYASSSTMTEAPSSLMQTISIKELVLRRCSLTSQSALDGLRLSLSRKVKWSTLNFCEFYLLRFYFYPKTHRQWFED